jgi:hypothetical protein
MATQRNPDDDLPTTNTGPEPGDLAREIFPLTTFSDWDIQNPSESNNKKTPEDYYRELFFTPGVEEAEPQKPADSGGPAKS